MLLSTDPLEKHYMQNIINTLAQSGLQYNND